MGDYSYGQYLEQWEDHFGEDTQGEFIYWQLGKKKSRILPKMTEEQFSQTLSQFDILAPKIGKLQNRDDYVTNDEIGGQVDRLLAESFECELPLFF